MSNIYNPDLKNIPIRYAWDKKKKEYYTCIPISQNHKQSKGWWNVIWEVDNTRSVVNLSEKAFYNGNWAYLHKQKKQRKPGKKKPPHEEAQAIQDEDLRPDADGQQLASALQTTKLKKFTSFFLLHIFNL